MFDIRTYTGSDGIPLRYGLLTNPERPHTGKSLLFLPGLGGTVKGAIHFLELLLPEFSPIYGPDLRGFGLNPIDTPLNKAGIFLEDLEAFHQQVIAPNHADRLSLCGISLGGVLATLLAARTPERFADLTLLAPAFKPHRGSFSMGYVLRNTLSHLFLGSRARTGLPYGMSTVTNNPAILEDPQFQGALELILTPGFLLDVRNYCNRAFKAVETLTLPTLMVVPGQDLVCDPDTMRLAFRKIPDSTPKRLQEYPQFYHDVLFDAEHPKLAQETLEWLLSMDSCATSFSSR